MSASMSQESILLAGVPAARDLRQRCKRQKPEWQVRTLSPCQHFKYPA
jgi:hypothetical protein